MITAIIPLFIGTTELLLIGGIALLLFGGKKLPEMMRGLGKGVAEFKSGMKEGNAADGEPVEPNGQNGAELNQSDGEKNEQAE
jgi:sec-independent protein translocase protein TatA